MLNVPAGDERAVKEPSSNEATKCAIFTSLAVDGYWFGASGDPALSGRHEDVVEDVGRHLKRLSLKNVQNSL